MIWYGTSFSFATLLTTYDFYSYCLVALNCMWRIMEGHWHTFHCALGKHWNYNPHLYYQSMGGCQHHGWPTYMWHDCHLLCLQHHHPLKVMEKCNILSVTCSSSSFSLKTFRSFWPYCYVLWFLNWLCSPPVLSSLVLPTAGVHGKRNRSKKFTLC